MEKEMCDECGEMTVFGEESRGNFVCEDCMRLKDGENHDREVDRAIDMQRGLI